MDVWADGDVFIEVSSLRRIGLGEKDVELSFGYIDNLGINK